MCIPKIGPNFVDGAAVMVMGCMVEARCASWGGGGTTSERVRGVDTTMGHSNTLPTSARWAKIWPTPDTMEPFRLFGCWLGAP